MNLMNLSEGIKLFNERDFFSAHDYFENLWMEADRENKIFLQGLIQVSVGSFHAVCGNIKGAKSQYVKALSKLSKYSSVYCGINVKLLTEYINNNLEEISKVETKQKKVIDLNLLPTIKQI
jgi:predicted metal-dependent hydrolase